MVFVAAVNFYPILYEKMKIFAEKIDGLLEFKASNGWLHNFKSRHGI